MKNGDENKSQSKKRKKKKFEWKGLTKDIISDKHLILYSCRSLVHSEISSE